MKKLFSFVCALVCAMSLSAKTVYLDVSPIDWDKDGAKIAAWVWTGSGQGSWAGGTYMTKLANGYYTAEVGDNTKIKFVRLSSSTGDTPNWGNNNANVWNSTGDINIPTTDNDLYKMTEWSNGAWSSRTFTVAGVGTIFVNNWSVNDTNNDMVKQDDGTYKWEKKNVTLSAGEYTYKVVVNHNWKPELMGEQKINVATSGQQDITITYNANTNTANATVTLVKEEVVVPKIQVTGSFFELVDGKWDIRDLTPAEDKSIASIKVTMEAGTYEFKVIKDGSWLGNNGTMERNNCTGWNFYGDAGNAKLKADAKGDYTFTWTYETNALSVTFPAATATDLIGADSDSKAVKIVRDGQLLIVRDGVTYNMMGSVVK